MKLLFLLAMAGHILCGVADCLFTYGSKGKVDLTALKDHEKAQSTFEGMSLKNLIAGMLLGYVGLLVFAVTFFVMVVSGQTDLPRWACVFNTLPLFLALAPTSLPAKGNIAGTLMFLGLFVVGM